VDNVNRLIVVSFEGTNFPIQRNNVANTNSLLSHTPVRYCTRCEAATGYLEAFFEVRDRVVNAVVAQRVLHTDYQVVTTGHSLGGALATIAALELRSAPLNIPVHLVRTTSWRVQSRAILWPKLTVTSAGQLRNATSWQH
jgi:hypothetical protein